MKVYWLAVLSTAAALALSGCGQSSTGSAQSETSQQQAASDWYN